jgi:hypothetical protein
MVPLLYTGAMMSVDETLMCSFHILKPTDKKTTAAKVCDEHLLAWFAATSLSHCRNWVTRNARHGQGAAKK